jgi:hypothetical protein
MVLLFIVLLLHLVCFYKFLNIFFGFRKVGEAFLTFKKKITGGKKNSKFFFFLKRISQNSEIFVAKDLSFYLVPFNSIVPLSTFLIRRSSNRDIIALGWKVEYPQQKKYKKIKQLKSFQIDFDFPPFHVIGLS